MVESRIRIRPVQMDKVAVLIAFETTLIVKSVKQDCRVEKRIVPQDPHRYPSYATLDTQSSEELLYKE